MPPLVANEIKTRIQNKEATFNQWQASNVVALKGELIVYAPEGSRAARLKIGDGETTVANLPFIDAGTVNGRIIEEVIQIYDNLASFPRMGDSDNNDPQQMSLYVDASTHRLYYWDRTAQDYYVLSGLTYIPQTRMISTVRSWSAGTPATAGMNFNTLCFTGGTAPSLVTDEPFNVVTGITSQ